MRGWTPKRTATGIRGGKAPRWVALLAPILFAVPSQADRYSRLSAEIELTAITWRGNGTPEVHANGKRQTSQWTVAVECVLGTNEWQLEGNFARDGRNKWSFDGTNVCNSLQVTGPPPEDLRRRLTNTATLPAIPSAADPSNLTIYVHTTPGGCPLDNMSVNIPWLAFCSGGYLKRPDRILPLPVADVGHAPEAFAYTDQTDVFADDLGLRRRVRLLTSRVLHDVSVRDFRASYHMDTNSIPPSTVPDGLVKFVYSVT